MIPNVALMISAYIGFRMIEVFLLAPSRYANRTSRIVACILAAIAFLVRGLRTVCCLAAPTS
jgi:hypothetical protein